ncbi:hypothetical protein [Paenibacillus mucilaginosus]|uniref:hypothetical protein n=1 Tax=Paenibacillus mucilaginosus TaxID=61624 RepID=UPI00240E7F19|nr:hypothetical protein [Paenibacillus mucilaginosus]
MTLYQRCALWALIIAVAGGSLPVSAQEAPQAAAAPAPRRQLRLRRPKRSRLPGKRAPMVLPRRAQTRREIQPRKGQAA